ncbi:TraR/DksA C4-type zinc finger protein [Bacteriovorax sp. Seq25_V]|uniref:TraR/DksA family transcriptional regulator n=1 Tax=Bacteriovorax sp. Seq25_V TaxID=1201288 RepID=UPI000389FDAA|nr:TraR/DksA C4-type zinc finger protein [Bacteriovorax sp. Seq25_V]EQC46096.1 putative RNA polymerase-binding protein DksA [Bacteriovorax sp. Seq25_V]
MNQLDLNHFKILFEALKGQLLTKVSSVAENGLENLNSGDLVDQINNERDAKLNLKLQGRDQLFLKKIDHALEKIENGTFGECEDCGTNIGTKRLMARPIATHCINCKEEMERAEGHLLYSKKSKTNGREIVNSTTISFATNDSADNDNRVVNITSFGRDFEEKSMTS